MQEWGKLDVLVGLLELDVAVNDVENTTVSSLATVDEGKKEVSSTKLCTVG